MIKTKFTLAALTLGAFLLKPSVTLATEGVSKGQKDAAALVNELLGTFTSTAHAQRDPDFRDVTLNHCMATITGVPGYADGHYLYIEQALSNRLNKPYRQRFYRIKAMPDSKVIVSTTFEPTNAFVLASAINLCNKPLEARTYAWSEIGNAKCDIFIERKGNVYSGGTAAQGCPSTLFGATYMLQNFSFHKDVMTSWDRGYDAAGTQVWGSEKGAYEFVKVAPSSDPFPATPPKNSKCDVSGWSLETSTMFQKVVGTWEGTWYRYDAAGGLINSFKSTLEQKVENCMWVQKNSYPQPDGTVKVNSFTGKVVGPGVVQFDGQNDPRFIAYEAFVKEVSDTSLVYEVSHKLTGQITYVETITVVSPNQRLRVGQRYSDRGEFQGTTTIVETRTK
jgi:hypothetical protein